MQYSVLMGSLRNKWWQNLLGVVGLLAVLSLSVRLILNFPRRKKRA
jgi:manganese transport protein